MLANSIRMFVPVIIIKNQDALGLFKFIIRISIGQLTLIAEYSEYFKLVNVGNHDFKTYQ